jgi:hypothetical protein
MIIDAGLTLHTVFIESVLDENGVKTLLNTVWNTTNRITLVKMYEFTFTIDAFKAWEKECTEQTAALENTFRDKKLMHSL